MVMLTHQFANSCNLCYTNLKTFNHLTRLGGGGGRGGGGLGRGVFGISSDGDNNIEVVFGFESFDSRIFRDS